MYPVRARRDHDVDLVYNDGDRLVRGPDRDDGRVIQIRGELCYPT